MRIMHVVPMMLLAVAACEPAAMEPAVTAERQVVAVGDTIELRPGAVAGITGSQVSILFRGVAQDSRCPIDALCVWEGDAHVQLSLAFARRGWEPVALHTALEPKAVVFEGYTIRLVSVAPARRSDDDVQPADYSIRLAITRP